MSRRDQAVDQAKAFVDAFVAEHRALAIPTLIAICVDWAVERGGSDVIRGTLRRAIKLADELEADRRRLAQ